MMKVKLQEMLSGILQEVKQVTKSVDIVGEPVEVAGKQLIPISRVMVGFATGGGEGVAQAGIEAFGGCAGGGAWVEPIGFIIIDEDKFSFLPTGHGMTKQLVEPLAQFFSIITGRDKRSQQGQPPQEEV